MKPTIVFTGGHHNSALVVASYLKKEGYQIAWIGHKFAAGGDKSLSAEYQEVVRNQIPFYELKTGKFYQQFNPFTHLKTAFGFLQALFLLLIIRPKFIVSFGGYLSVPVVIAGWFVHIDSVSHEQTVVAGWANRAIAPFVRKMFLTHSSSLASYPAKKAMLVGLPLRPELFDPKLKQVFVPKLLYVSCGKQGSHLVNSALFPLVPKLVKHFTLVHQTGANTQTRDLDKARRVKESLGELSDRYQFAPYFFAKEAAIYLQSASVVISRAGAHLTYELSVLQKRTVFIPISWVSHNEQLLNAKEAARVTPAVIIEERDLTSQSLYDAIRQVAKMKRTKKEKIDPLSATKKIVDVIHGYLEN
jgi:UDP-N-acetylglucosamine--N-acetylmuramyl-(pentapeptide) pyrophosphoryl-undecaprenol N-acetylglucosamine transferase